MKTFLRYFVIGLSFMAFSEAAIAQTVCTAAGGCTTASSSPTISSCSDVVSQYNSCVQSSTINPAFCDPTYYTQRHPECFGTTSSTAAAKQSIQGTSFQQLIAISSALSARASARFLPPGKQSHASNDSGLLKGLAGGDAAQMWNVWGNASSNTAKYEHKDFLVTGGNGTTATNKFDSRIQNIVLGGDYQIMPTLVVGLSASNDTGNGSTISGQSNNTATPLSAMGVSTSGTSYAPYIGWQISQELALDAQMGWGDGTSNVGGSSQTDTRRFFYGINLGYTNWYDNWQLTGRGSYLSGEERSKDTVDSITGTVANSATTSRVGQFRVGGQAGYWMNGFMPYFGLAYTSDQRSSSASQSEQDATDMGRNAIIYSLGANLISKSNLTGGFSYEQEARRDRSNNNNFMVNINYHF